ncbi:MAG: hypothetical protein N2049_01800, partial [Anaerolineales bacterium]|nr:hypothetical protein [Anaerolineales bacterium]
MRKLGLSLLLTLAFAATYTQSPLFTSNQYQYFLHGLAQAGVGMLREDWLANTADPTPLFSLLIEWTARLGWLPLTYVYYACLMGIYLFALLAIAETLFPLRNDRTTLALFLTLIFLTHSAALRFLLTRWPGPAWAYLFDGGVAGQRLLGPVFQPSVFGVLLLVALWLMLKDRPILGALTAVAAASIHPTYLLSAASLTLACLLDLWRRGDRKRLLQTALSALMGVLPILMYTWLHFGGSDPVQAERARQILMNIRIPHHARLAEWFDLTVLIKLAIILVSLYLARGQRLAMFLGVPFSLALMLTCLQGVTGNAFLALLFPWRLSTWLVPVGTALLAGWAARRLSESHLLSQRTLLAGSLGVIVVLVALGGVRMALDWDRPQRSPAWPMQQFVARVRQPGQVYLIPPKMYDFRLHTGAPVYGDFYAIPYRDEDVIEWYSRFLNARRFYDTADCVWLQELIVQGVTHVVLPSEFSTLCPDLERLYHCLL